MSACRSDREPAVFRPAADILALLVLVAVAVAVRGPALSAALEAPYLDKYPLAAELLQAGQLPDERWLDFSPLYLALHVAVVGLGLPARPTILGLQLTLGAAVVLLTFSIARKDGLAAGVLAGLAVAGGRMAVAGGLLLEPELWLATFLLSGAALAASERPRPIGAGVAFGAAALVRPTALLVPLLLSFTRPRRQAVLTAGLAAAVAVAGLGLWLYPRVAVSDWPALMSPGQVFHQGNGPEASGIGLHYPLSVEAIAAGMGTGRPDFHHQAYRIAARAETGRCLSARQVEGFWRRLALSFLERHPKEGLRRAARRMLGTLHRRQVWDVAGAQMLEQRVGWRAPVDLPLLLGLAVVGAFAGRPRLVTAIGAAVAVPVATGLVFFVSARHRIALDVLLAPLAGVGAVAAWRWLGGGGESRRAGRPALLAGCLAFLVPYLQVASIDAGRDSIASIEAGERALRTARALSAEAPEDARRQLFAEAVIHSQRFLEQVPLAIREDPRFLHRLTSMATERIRNGDEKSVENAAVLLAALEDCPRLFAALKVREKAGRSLPPGPALRVVASACALQRREGVDRAVATLETLARTGQLTLYGYGFLAAGRVAAGGTMEQALSVFPPWYDRISALAIVRQSLFEVGRPEVGREVGRVLERRVTAAVGCSTEP